jgi:hypothetical protein
MAKDAVVAMILKAYPSVALAMAAAKSLRSAIVGAILTKTFVEHTVHELTDEEMEVTPHSRLSDHKSSLCPLPGPTRCGIPLSCVDTLTRGTSSGYDSGTPGPDLLRTSSGTLILV